MSIFAIGDLHLSFSANKPMDIFGGEWVNHAERLKKNWETNISHEDTVIIVGDTSWALHFDDYLIDALWISELPGKKLLVKGNHDLWWSTLTKMNKNKKETIDYIQNNFMEAEADGIQYAICGTRGWLCPGDDDFKQKDERIYLREINRLKLSLEGARAAGYGLSENQNKKIICGIHFPPTNDKHQGSGFTELCSEYGVSTVVYGHLHGNEAFKNGIKGTYNGVEYKLVSLDYIKCQPLKLT